MLQNNSFLREKEKYERKQRERITALRENSSITLPEWHEIMALECYRDTTFFFRTYGSIVQTMKDHANYRHLKGATINRGKYYTSGDPIYLVRMGSYLAYEFLLPTQGQQIHDPGTVRDLDREDVPLALLERFFYTCLQRHQQADDIYGDLDLFVQLHPDFEHLEQGWLRNRQEYQEQPEKQPLIDLGNYVVYELRNPLHKTV